MDCCGAVACRQTFISFVEVSWVIRLGESIYGRMLVYTVPAEWQTLWTTGQHKTKISQISGSKQLSFPLLL